MSKKKQQAKIWKSARLDMLYLTMCGINSLVPQPERVTAMDLPKVFGLSKAQSLEAITYIALERMMKDYASVPLSAPEPLLKQWEESRNKVIRKTLLMDAEREKLFSYMEAQKIWYLPLKGVVLSQLYPEFGMRQMSDNDILFDAVFRQEIYDWFTQHGYRVESFMNGNHDEYHKEPIYNFEMHTALFDEKIQPKFASYYHTIRDKLHLAPGKKYAYCMTDEDFYLYMLTHEYKHHSDMGTGLRSLLDLYVYHTAKSNMNRVYLDGELKKLGLLDFEKEMVALAMNVFVPQTDLSALSQQQQNLLNELLYNCTYGSSKMYWKNQIKNIQPNEQEITTSVKIRYLIQRIFPSKIHMEIWCEMYAPFFLRNRWLMPAARIWRIVKRGKENKKIIKSELDTVRKI